MGRGKNSATVRRQLSNLLKVFCNPFSLLSPFSVVSWWYVKCCSMQYVKQFSYGLMFPFSSFFFVCFFCFGFLCSFFFNSMYGVTLNVCGVMYWVVTVCVMETFCILSSGTGLKWDLKFHRSHHTFIQPSCQKPLKKKSSWFLFGCNKPILLFLLLFLLPKQVYKAKNQKMPVLQS